MKLDAQVFIEICEMNWPSDRTTKILVSVFALWSPALYHALSAQKPWPEPPASAFQDLRPGQSHVQAVTLARPGPAQSGPASAGPRLWAGPGTSLVGNWPYSSRTSGFNCLLRSIIILLLHKTRASSKSCRFRQHFLCKLSDFYVSKFDDPCNIADIIAHTCESFLPDQDFDIFSAWVHDGDHRPDSGRTSVPQRHYILNGMEGLLDRHSGYVFRRASLVLLHA